MEIKPDINYTGCSYWKMGMGKKEPIKKKIQTKRKKQKLKSRTKTTTIEFKRIAK